MIPRSRTGVWRDLFRIAVLGGSRALAALIGFLAVWQISQRLAPEALGIWSIALALMGFALHLSEWGLRSVVTAEAGVRSRVWWPLIRHYLKMRLFLSAMVICLSTAASYVIWPGHTALIVVLLLCIPGIAAHLDWIALVRDRPELAGGFLLAKPALFAFFLWFFPNWNEPLSIAMALLLAWWGSAILSWLLLQLAERSGPPVASDRKWISLGWPLMCNTLINQMQLSLDLILLGWTAGAALAGHYYLAAAVVAAGLVFANASGQIATARMARYRNLAVQFRSSLRTQLALTCIMSLLMAVGLAILAPALMGRVFGSEHQKAADLVFYLLPWFVAAGISSHLQGALAADLRQPLINKGNLVLLLTLLPGLAAATFWGEPLGFALARAAGETCRLWVLSSALRCSPPAVIQLRKPGSASPGPLRH